MSDLAALDGARYVLLTTFRASGEGVATPVWFARTAPDAIVVTTEHTSGKVKRLAADPTCTLAACDIRGRVTGGTVAGVARILEGDEARAADDALARTYGLEWRAFSAASRLRGRDPDKDRAHLEVRAA